MEIKSGRRSRSNGISPSVTDNSQKTVSKVHSTLEKAPKIDQKLDKTREIVDKYGADKTTLIQILLEIQRENRWLPRDALQYVSEKLDIPLSQVYRVATFYTAFSLIPQGRHHVCVCMGTACHVRGSPRLLDLVTNALSITPGETSPDHKFTLTTVNCLGCCALGPVLQVDNDYHGNPSAEEVKKIVAGCD
jgi:NADH-quinone oxidoreductase subunit E